MQELKKHIEALIFCSEESISLDEIAVSLKLSFGWEAADGELESAIEEIRLKYQSDDFAFELVEIAEGYEFLTKKEYHATISALIQHKAKKKLSVAQMETLSIIAYRQPISKPEIEHIRGVNCDYAMQKLLEKELIEMTGKSEGPGKPMMYATSQLFMDYFGIKSVKELPTLKDIRTEQNEIGNASEFADAPLIEENSSKEIISEEMIVDAVGEIITDENPDMNFIPDRKSILLKHEEESKEKKGSHSKISSDDNES